MSEIFKVRCTKIITFFSLFMRVLLQTHFLPRRLSCQRDWPWKRLEATVLEPSPFAEHFFAQCENRDKKSEGKKGNFVYQTEMLVIAGKKFHGSWPHFQTGI